MAVARTGVTLTWLLVVSLMVLAGCATPAAAPTVDSDPKPWAQLVCDAGGGTVIVQSKSTSYSSFLIIEGSKITRIGDFQEPRVKTERQNGRMIVTIIHEAGRGTGILQLNMTVIVLRQDVDSITRYANFPAGGHKDAAWDDDGVWGRRKLEVKITKMSLLKDDLSVEYDLIDQGKIVQHLVQAYPLSKDADAWTDCPRVSEYLAIDASKCRKVPGTNLLVK